MFFNVNKVHGPAQDILNIEIIGSFSVDGDERYLNDLSQLKYYKEPSNIENVDLDLNELKDTVMKSTRHNKLDFTLNWVSENIDTLKMQDFENTERWLQPEFILNRGTLSKLLMTPYVHKDWIICASKFKGTIYMCYFYTDEQEEERLNESDYSKRLTSWGFKFEQYMRSESPNAGPDLSVPLNQNEEFRCVFKSVFGNKTLLYVAEIDAISTQEVINNTLPKKNVELIELKTVFSPSSEADKTKNSFYPILRWWAQCYPVNINNIVCGCKNATGQVKGIKKYKLSNFDDHIKDKQQRCKSFCNEFLDYMKVVVKNDYDNSLYQFKYNGKNKKIIVKKMKPDETSRYTLLYPWYIEKLKNYFENV
ncbi:decapping and exoribonuclease protein-like [Xylocopa sonorina]|uniref:decapping and exoribonuclease protein-like n=1 Tax=Xylocopa sonorina TaxID=1818115 RepID=UPI00403ADFE8